MSTATKTGGYGIDKILEVIESLSYAQGFYGRVLQEILYAKDNEPDRYEQIKEELENRNFRDPIDIIFYFEG